jgi:hypothetical protein
LWSSHSGNPYCDRALARALSELTDLASKVPTTLASLAAFVADGGSFSVNSVPSFGTVAAAHMKESTIAMLRQHPGESMLELLDRLEFAIIEAIATGYVVNEVNVQPPKKSRRK